MKEKSGILKVETPNTPDIEEISASKAKACAETCINDEGSKK